MQSNTTGYSMETFFDIMIVILLIANLALIIIMSKKVESIDLTNEFFQRKFVITIDGQEIQINNLERKLKEIFNQIKDDNDRSLQAILERLDAAKPIKSNNWDSVKEAFKGPVRIELNERN